MTEEKKDDEQLESEDQPEKSGADESATDAADEKDQQLADLQDKMDSVQNDYLKAEAEIQNIQKRHKKEQAEQSKYAGKSLAEDIIPALDGLDRALSVEVSDENGKQLKSGIEMVKKQLDKALADNNISEINAEGEFDPKLHQAVQTVPADDDHKAGQIVSVLQKGYQIADRVIRPAMVVVAQ